MIKRLIIFGLFLVAVSCKVSEQQNDLDRKELPRVWVTYKGDNPKEDFPDLASKGVGAVSVRKASSEILKLARENNLKLILWVPEIIESAYLIPQDKVERAVMIGGAYKGKAIDRFRFAFTPEQHTILIESPRYDRTDCYKTMGMYFPGMRDPVKAEVIIKHADFDGKQHLSIIPATVGEQTDSVHWPISFDLTGVEGDLRNVSLAVYWISEGTRDYWMFGDAASPASEATKEQIRLSVRKLVNQWEEANNGEFPSEDVIAVRIGDECFHLSGHGNCDACSYPLWDFSESTVATYRKQTNLHYPRGKAWPDMYGREAYALWLYNYHNLMAGLMTVVKDELNTLGLKDVLTFRNITRYNIFHTLNDHDGSGLDLLAKNLDIVHVDPYPINAAGYRDEVIPVDMAYVAGLARRHNKYLVPWMQSHQYWPEFGGLAHPDAGDVEKMVQQQLKYAPDAIMWLGYGKPPFNTFPHENKEAWEKAGELHHAFIKSSLPDIQADVAVLRPYTVRALRDIDSTQWMDRFFTDEVITWLSMNDIPFDPFEPLDLSSVTPSDLSYDKVIAEAASLSKEELEILADFQGTPLVFIFEADHYNISQSLTGIEAYISRHYGTFTTSFNGESINVTAFDEYRLSDQVRVLASIDDTPVIWKNNNIIFVSCIIQNDIGVLLRETIHVKD